VCGHQYPPGSNKVRLGEYPWMRYVNKLKLSKSLKFELINMEILSLENAID
jgi:hypothetical protein